MNRRSFLFAAGSACLVQPGHSFAAGPESSTSSHAVRDQLQSFDYRGVRLLDSRFQQQAVYARTLYFNMSNDDMLKGFRREAGLPAPGNDMRGWCRRDCGATFGQWISGMARLSCATGDTALKNKAIYLTTEWEKTLGAGGNPRMGTYAWEKMSCGLVDLALYADYPHALEILESITQWASKHFDRSRSPATEADRDGRRPHGTLEWYTLPENCFRAYAITGNKTFLDFANLWLYPSYWDKFADTARPQGVEYLHSYSHMNTFCGAAMAYAVTHEPRYLSIVRNAYEWARGTQTYASGGYGPGEWSVPADGTLGRALDVRLDTAEIPCGSWAGFKLSRYLMGITSDARYGDWIETLMYNGIGAALPVQPDGRSFYYADYRVGMGAKTFFWDEWPCCSGTYIQTIADYHNVIYFHDEGGLYVNLAVPSEVEWRYAGQTVRLTQQTSFPETDETALHLQLERPAEFALHIRVPAWSSDASVLINGRPFEANMQPNHWGTLKRTWQSGDSKSCGVVRLPHRNPDAVLVPVDAFDPHGKDFIRSHAAVLQYHDYQSGLLPQTKCSAMLDRISISLLEPILCLLIHHLILPRSFRQPDLRDIPQQPPLNGFALHSLQNTQSLVRVMAGAGDRFLLFFIPPFLIFLSPVQQRRSKTVDPPRPARYVDPHAGKLGQSQ